MVMNGIFKDDGINVVLMVNSVYMFWLLNVTCSCISTGVLAIEMGRITSFLGVLF